MSGHYAAWEIKGPGKKKRTDGLPYTGGLIIILNTMFTVLSSRQSHYTRVHPVHLMTVEQR